MVLEYRRFGMFTKIMATCFTLITIASCGFNDGNDDDDSETPEEISIVILQTSDLHHHAAGYGPQADYTPLDSTDNDSVMGGYARLSGLIKQIRSDAAAEEKSVLLFDSGDFLMGTIYDLTASDPIAFKFFETMEYDAVTLGNHEFDWRNQGLCDLFDAGMLSGFDVPVVASNLVTDPLDAGDDDIEALIENGAIVASKIINVTDDLQVGILGVMGRDADNAASLADPVTFNHDDVFLQDRVNELKSDGADLIVLLSHTGIHSDGSGEDAEIAENVTGIDIIASGHMHTATTTEFTQGASNTIIFSPGEYGSYLSRLDITYNKTEKRITDHTFELLPVDDTVAGDEDMDELVESYDAVINAALSDYGVNEDTVISAIDFDLEIEPLQETGFGNLIADAIRQAASDLDAVNPEPYDVSVIGTGVIRDNFYRGRTGDITFSDVYNALPLGRSIFGDTNPGYPMMSVYVTAGEIRNICEISVSAAPLMGANYYQNISGVRYDYNPSNELMAQVTDVYIVDSSDMNTVGPGTRLDLTDETTLYHLTVNFYALSMMDLATSMGLAIVPKDHNGVPLSLDDLSNARIDISADNDIQELKEWMALKHYLEANYPSTGTGIPIDVYGNNGTGMGRANAIATP